MAAWIEINQGTVPDTYVVTVRRDGRHVHRSTVPLTKEHAAYVARSWQDWAKRSIGVNYKIRRDYRLSRRRWLPDGSRTRSSSASRSQPPSHSGNSADAARDVPTT